MSEQAEEAEVDVDVDEEVPEHLEEFGVEDFENEHVEDLELPEPEESEWEEGTSPYDDEDQPEQDVAEVQVARIFSWVRTGAAAVRWCLSKTSWWPSGMCQQFTRTTFNVGSGAPSAAAAWHQANKRHPTNSTTGIPAAVPVFWLGGSRGFGHAAVSLGNGLCRSTDWPSAGRVGTARISDINRAWGQDFQGWTEDINEVTVWEKPKPKLPIIDVSNAARATRREGKIKNALVLKRAVNAELKKAKDVDTDHRVLGRGFRGAYKEVQKKYLKAIGVKVTEKNADGIPGAGSLRWLGRRHGFRVRD